MTYYVSSGTLNSTNSTHSSAQLRLWDIKLGNWWLTGCVKGTGRYGAGHPANVVRTSLIWFNPQSALTMHLAVYAKSSSSGLVGGWLDNFFVNVISQDLQKSYISKVACKQHVVGGRCLSNFFYLIFGILPKNQKNSSYSWTQFLRIYKLPKFQTCVKRACGGRSLHR